MLVASEVAARPGVETVPTVEFDMPSVVMVAPDDGSHIAGRASPRCGCSEKSRPFERSFCPGGRFPSAGGPESPRGGDYRGIPCPGSKALTGHLEDAKEWLDELLPRLH
jgi:hypothetical protein